jgi:hypothetical protein
VKASAGSIASAPATASLLLFDLTEILLTPRG